MGGVSSLNVVQQHDAAVSHSNRHTATEAAVTPGPGSEQTPASVHQDDKLGNMVGNAESQLATRLMKAAEKSEKSLSHRDQNLQNSCSRPGLCGPSIQAVQRSGSDLPQTGALQVCPAFPLWGLESPPSLKTTCQTVTWVSGDPRWAGFTLSSVAAGSFTDACFSQCQTPDETEWGCLQTSGPAGVSSSSSRCPCFVCLPPGVESRRLFGQSFSSSSAAHFSQLDNMSDSARDHAGNFSGHVSSYAYFYFHSLTQFSQ